MKTRITAIGGTVLAIIGTFGGAMLTTDYATMRKNGASYLPAIQSGLGSVAQSLWEVVISPWFLVPVGVIVIIALTVKMTLRATRPKQNPMIILGHQMHEYVRAAHYDKRFRGLSSVYHDTMRICREMEAFMVQIEMRGLPVPKPQSQYAEEWIDLCCEYFEAVGPYLRGGNVTHAMSVASRLAAKHPLRR